MEYKIPTLLKGLEILRNDRSIRAREKHREAETKLSIAAKQSKKEIERYVQAMDEASAAFKNGQFNGELGWCVSDFMEKILETGKPKGSRYSAYNVGEVGSKNSYLKNLADEADKLKEQLLECNTPTLLEIFLKELIKDGIERCTERFLKTAGFDIRIGEIYARGLKGK